MKKLSIFVGALTLTSSLFAQDLTSKKGENYLPEAKDWALGIDAVPFLNYFGNFIGGNGLNVAPTFNYATRNQTIVGKYYVEEKMAYRGALRLGFGSSTETNIVADRAADNTFLNYPSAVPTKENQWKSGYRQIGLSGGLEWRKGNTRLQGFYGGELGIMLGGGKQTFSYGNALTVNAVQGAVAVSAADEFNGYDADMDGVGGDNITVDNTTQNNAARILVAKNSSFGLGIRGFIGVEYFIIPKLSLGGEFGWGIAMMSEKNSTEMESVGNDIFSGLQVYNNGHKTESGKNSTSMVDTDVMNSVFGNMGQIKITFHF
jgi:hypothetical protein